MSDKLFVYGTLGLGRPNEHVLTDIGGTWEAASVIGNLIEKGWGAEMGYPGLELDESGEKIEGFVFTSEFLAHHWTMLDEFEGDAYQRVVTKVLVKSGQTIDANVYILRE